MNLDQFLIYCNSKKGVEETFPFDESTLVFKVMGKMFALTGLNQAGFKVNLKCNPERSVELRDNFEGIKPGFHMNKLHWNTVDFESDVDEKLIKELIDHSYDLVVSGLTKKLKEALNKL